MSVKVLFMKYLLFLMDNVILMVANTLHTQFILNNSSSI